MDFHPWNLDFRWYIWGYTILCILLIFDSVDQSHAMTTLYISIYIYISPIFLHTNVSQRVVVCDPPNPPKQLGGCTSTSPTSRLKARSLASSTGAHGPRTHHDLGHRSERSVLQSRPRRGRKLARREGPTPRQPGDSGAWTRPVPGTVKWLSDSNCD